MGEMKGEKKESKKRAFEKIEELKKITLEAKKKRRDEDEKDEKKCWFDGQKCFFSLEIKGFEDARREWKEKGGRPWAEVEREVERSIEGQ